MNVGESADRLVYRRQFILGPRRSSLGLGWPRLPVASRFVLEAHPDLPVTQVSDGRTELTLVGIMLDPANPGRPDVDVVRNLLPAAGDERALLDELRRMGGRWALVAAGNRPPVVLHDLCGLRQVVFVTTPEGCWCASQPTLLAAELSLVQDAAGASFLSSLYVRAYRESWWPGTRTPYAEVTQLLPSHALELETGCVRRYWPSSPRTRLALAEGVERAASLLRGVVEAAARRFPLALALTAGVDSRAVMAAARPFIDDVYVYTLTNTRLGLSERDATVAGRVAARAGVAHHRIECPTTMDSWFASIHRGNTSTPHEAWGATAFGLYRNYPPDRVSMTGNCSEVSRRGYRRLRPVDVAGLARLENMVANPLAREWIAGWLAEAEQIPASLDYPLVDLYYLENRMGRWLAGGLLESDIAQETVAPFNCRALAEALLCLDIADRDPPESRAHRRIIELLWPELLAEPFNPATPTQAVGARVKRDLARALRATHAYDRTKELQLRARTLGAPLRRR